PAQLPFAGDKADRDHLHVVAGVFPSEAVKHRLDVVLPARTVRPVFLPGALADALVVDHCARPNIVPVGAAGERRVSELADRDALLYQPAALVVAAYCVRVGRESFFEVGVHRGADGWFPGDAAAGLLLAVELVQDRPLALHADLRWPDLLLEAAGLVDDAVDDHVQVGVR